MTDLVYDYISMGVDMILTAAILSAIVVLLRSSVVLSSYQANVTATSDRMNYYKQFNAYDCTDRLCAADVVSALVYYRYDLSIVVDLGSGQFIHNDPKTGKFWFSKPGDMDKEKNASDLSSLIPVNRWYSGNLCENGASAPTGSPYSGGIITGIKFTVGPTVN